MTLPDNATISSSAIYDNLFDESLGHSEDRAVLIDAAIPDRYLTLGYLKRKIPILASNVGMIWPSFRPGDTIAQCSPNDIELVLAAQGFIFAGATMAVVDHTRENERAIARDMKIAEAKFIFTHRDVLDKVLRAAKHVGIPKSHILLCGNTPFEGVNCLAPLLEKTAETSAPPTLTRSIRDPVYLVFTSGTTGPSKAVMISHETLLHRLDIYKPDVQPKPSSEKEDHRQAIICFSQFYHGASLSFTLVEAILKAKTMYLMNTFNVKEFCKNVQKYNATESLMLPHLASSIVRDPIIESYDMSSLTNVTMLGEHPDISLRRDFKQKLGIDVLIRYGMTEVLPSFVYTKEYGRRGAIGKLAPCVQVKLVDEEGREGKEGELLIKGPNVTPGYFNNEEATKAAFDEEGFFRSGDILKVDDDGVYSFVSRKKEMIKYAGYKMYPRVIEKIVCQAPNVAQCAVVGIYDAHTCTQLLTAFVEPIKPADQSAFDEAVKKTIARDVMEYVDSQVPEDCYRLRGGIVVVDELPLNSIGKVLRTSLRSHPGTIRHVTFQP